MTIEQKGKLIAAIIAHLKFECQNKLARLTPFEQASAKPFDEGETFFSLAFKSDKDLQRIAKLAGL